MENPCLPYSATKYILTSATHVFRYLCWKKNLGNRYMCQKIGKHQQVNRGLINHWAVWLWEHHSSRLSLGSIYESSEKIHPPMAENSDVGGSKCSVRIQVSTQESHWGWWSLHHGMVWKLKGENDERSWGYNGVQTDRNTVSIHFSGWNFWPWMKMETFWNQELADWPSCHSILTYAAHGRRHFLAPSGLWILTLFWGVWAPSGTWASLLCRWQLAAWLVTVLLAAWWKGQKGWHSLSVPGKKLGARCLSCTDLVQMVLLYFATSFVCWDVVHPIYSIYIYVCVYADVVYTYIYIYICMPVIQFCQMWTWI